MACRRLQDFEAESFDRPTHPIPIKRDGVQFVVGVVITGMSVQDMMHRQTRGPRAKPLHALSYSRKNVAAATPPIRNSRFISAK